MSNSTSALDLRVTATESSPGVAEFKLNIDGQPCFDKTHVLNHTAENQRLFFYIWLNVYLKDVLLENIHAHHIQIHLHGKKNIVEAFIGQFNQVALYANNTLKFIHELSIDPKETENFDKILFLNASDHDRFADLHAICQKKSPERILYKSFDTGYDAKARAFVNPDYPPLANFINDLVQQKIKTVIAFNMFYLEALRKTQNLFGLVIFKYLGIRYINCDYDTYDLPVGGQYYKSLFQENKGPRLSISPHMNLEWDRMLGLNQITSMPVFRVFDKARPTVKLTPDFGVMVLSNSRVADLNPATIQFAARVLADFPDNDRYRHFEMWYYALRRHVITSQNFSDFEKIEINRRAWAFYLNGLSLLKFDVIASLNTKRKIAIFGDAGWQKVFPEYYQNRFLPKDEIKTEFQSGRWLYLLMNDNYSPHLANPVIYDAMTHDVPFLSFPSIALTESLSEFRKLEYRNAQELGALLETPALFEWSEVTSVLATIKNDMKIFGEELTQFVLTNKKDLPHFDKCARDAMAAANIELDLFMKNYLPLIEESIEVLMSRKGFGMTPKAQAYLEKPVFQKLLTQ